MMKPNYYLNILMAILISYGISGCYKEINSELIEGIFYESFQDSSKVYEFIPETSKHVIYEAKFSTSEPGWWTGVSGALEAEIIQGFYHISNDDGSKLRWITLEENFDSSQDFELEAFIRVSSNDSEDGAGIGLRDSEDNLLNFILDKDNRIGITTWNETEEKFEFLENWKLANWINSFEGTFLTIRKSKDKVLYFADRKFIGYESNADVINPNKIVVFFKGDAEIYIDFIKFSYLLN